MARVVDGFRCCYGRPHKGDGTFDHAPRAAVLIGATEFAAVREHRRFLAAIGEGLADVNAGRVLTTQELKQSFEAEFGPIAWQ